MLNYRLSVGLIWCHRQSRFFLSHFRATFPHQTQTHNLLHICNPLCRYGPATNPVYHQKAIKFTSCQTSNTLQEKVGAITNLKGPYLRTTSDVNLSPTQASNIKIQFKRDSSSRARTGLSAAGRGCTKTL